MPDLPPGFTISDDKTRLDLPAIHAYLSQRSYWAVGRPLAVVQTSIEHSLCFGAYDSDGRQAGFARVVTDYATFGWVCDVFILEPYRGLGLSKRLMEAIVAYPALQGVKRLLLATRDAHELYQRYAGFQPLAAPERWMERRMAG